MIQARLFPILLLLVLFGSAVYVVHSADVAKSPNDGEIDRVRHHLERAERFLRTYEPDDLTDIQRARRARVISLVSHYRQQGVFPHHHDSGRDMELYFVDEHGRPCALASVLLQTGGAALVEAVRTYRNDGWVRDIMNEPGLRAEMEVWLESNGLTFADAATIQVPGYTFGESESEIPATYAVASGLSVGVGAVLTAINLDNLRSEGRTPAWLGLVSGVAAVGLGASQVNATGSRLTLATVDIVGGVLSVTTSAVRLLIGERKTDEFPPFNHGIIPEVRTDGKGNSLFALRMTF